MANVDQCVRECEAALCGNLDQHVANIMALPNDERIILFRNKPAPVIKAVLENCRQTIQAQIARDFYNGKISSDSIKLEKGSDNNKDGADIFHRLKNDKIIDIEVKFGQKTDKAVGMDKFAQIFDTAIFTTILSVKNRRAWVDEYLRENLDDAKQSARLFAELNRAAREFNVANQDKGNRLSSSEQTLMEKLIINNSGDDSSTSDYYLKFILDGGGMKEVKEWLVGVGVWEIIPVKLLDSSVARVNVFIVNHETNLQIKFTLNWKNNYKIAGHGKVSAKLGFNAPSWNVWIENISPS